MEIKICYIDDNLDPFLVSYLDKSVCNCPDYKYEEYEVRPSLSYNDLLENETINMSDILIIDSRLFEEVEYTENTLTGEELRFIIRKVFPYKEVLVISQNDTSEYDIESKFKPSSPLENSSFEGYEKEAKLFYDKRLLPKIKDCRESIEATKNIFDRISNKGYMNSSMLLEQIRDTIDGDNNYTELSKEDIDNLINNFTKLREELNV